MHNTEPLERKLAELTTDRARSPRMARLQEIGDSLTLTDYFSAEREALFARMRATAAAGTPLGGLATARELSDLMDGVVTRMFELACAQAGVNPAALNIALVATGGYGRRELCPYSDLDVTFIPYRDGDPHIDRVIKQMFTLLMDVFTTRSGLEVGYAYRLLEDCASLDHQTTCGLLDARLITGNDRLFIQFEDAFWSGFNPTEFLFAKLDERERALTKWGRIPRVVEPQLKEGPGGLRDLQTAIWAAQARNQWVAARVRGENAFGLLERAELLSSEEAGRLRAAKERLFQTRNALHIETGAERDQLVITRQEAVAELLGYASADDSAPPVERFMEDLYQHLALIRRLSGRIMRRMENSRLILGIGLDSKRRQIVPANDALDADDPSWLLWACELAQRYNLTFGDDLERTAAALVASNPILPDPAQAAEIFTRLLAKLGRVYPILQTMADTGILTWFLPEFGATLNLIPYDPSHDHTVGQHSLFVIKGLEDLLQNADNDESVEMRQLLENLPHPEHLLLAALLHDAGKAFPGRPHSEVSEEIARTVCARLGWSQEAAENVCFLVREHLVMAETSRLRDLSQEQTLRDFTRIVDDLDRLTMLYLLTYADTRAVGEGVWTQVKGRFLRELYHHAAAILTAEEPLAYDDARLARARRRLLKDLMPQNLPEAEVAEHSEAMPPYYLLNQSLSQIALHIAFVRQVRDGQLVLDFHDERDATYTELTVCTYDDPKPGLLARIARALYEADLNVHGAQVLTRITDRDRIALDTLWVDFRGRQLSPGKRREVTTRLTEALQPNAEGTRSLPKSGVLRAQSQAAAQQTLQVVSVRNDLSDTLTVIETSGTDLRGALYFLCDAFARLGWDIRSARVSTWRNEARAAFYVEGVRQLSEETVRLQLQNALAHAPSCTSQAASVSEG